MSYRPASRALQAGWIGGAAASVVLPLILLGISRIQHQRGSSSRSQQNSNYDDDDSLNEGNSVVPWWYIIIGSSRTRAQQGDATVDGESSSPPTILIAAYLWSLLVFIGIAYYGYMALRNNTSTEGILLALILFAIYNLITLFALGSVHQGGAVVESDVEEHGFMGQFGVMVYLTSLLWLLFSVLFAVWLRRRTRRSAVTKVTVDSADYRIHNDDNDDEDDTDDDDDEDDDPNIRTANKTQTMAVL